MKSKKLKIIIVMPAYNAAKTLKATTREIPKGIADSIVLVDDFSQDNTLEVARQLGLTVVTHSKNKGYGANQKTCYKAALEKGADIVVMLHPDHQYDGKLIEKLILPIKEGEFDIMLGSRIRTRREALKGGMPMYKYIGNRVLTLLANIITGQNLSEYHTGFRAFHKKALLNINFNFFSDDFIFDQQILLEAIKLEYKIGEVPVPVRYYPSSSSINFLQSCKYGFLTIVILLKSLIDYRKKDFI